MNGSALAFFLNTMAVQVPTLLVCAAGLAAAAVFLRRYPRPAVLTLVGTALLLLVTAGFSLAQAWLIQTRMDAGRSPLETAWMMSALGIGSSCLRAVGLGLVLLAVFAGRRRERVAPDDR